MLPEGGHEKRWTSTEAGEMPILAWVGVDPAHTTVERFRELAEAGFNQNLSFYADAGAMAKALDIAQQARVKMHVCYTDMLNDPSDAAKRFKDHPAVAAWTLKDEPSAADFVRLSKAIEQFEAADRNPDHFCYINLFPNYANPMTHEGAASQLGTATYQEHLDRFIKEVPVKVLSFDHYPITDKGLRPLWYQNLEAIARAAAEKRIPFWAFALSISHGPYPVPTLAHLRLQVYSDLAYGAQGIQYFTYWAPLDGKGQCPITADGKKSPVYDLVKQMNREIRGLSGVFVGSRVVALGHTGKIPEGTRPYAAVAPITGAKTGGDGAVVSVLARDKRRFLVIVNRDYAKPMPLEISWQQGAALASVRKDGTLEPIAAPKRQTAVEPGDVEILTWLEK